MVSVTILRIPRDDISIERSPPPNRRPSGHVCSYSMMADGREERETRFVVALTLSSATLELHTK